MWLWSQWGVESAINRQNINWHHSIKSQGFWLVFHWIFHTVFFLIVKSRHYFFYFFVFSFIVFMRNSRAYFSKCLLQMCSLQSTIVIIGTDSKWQTKKLRFTFMLSVYCIRKKTHEFFVALQIFKARKKIASSQGINSK